MTRRPLAKYVFLPVEVRKVWSPQAFLKKLPDVIFSIVDLRFGRNAYAVFKNYLIPETEQPTSLAAIGRRLGISKQASQAVFKRMIRRFREVMIEDTYRMCGFHVRREFSLPLRILATEVRRDPDPILLQSEWDALLARTWQMRSSDLGQMERFILEVLGLRRFDFSESTLGSIIVLASDRDVTRLLVAARFIQKLIVSHHPAGLTLQQITEAIRKRTGLRSLSEERIRVLMRCARDIEKVGDQYRTSGRSMMRRADHYEEILLRAGKPLHYRELARRAVPFGYRGNDKQHQSVTNILLPDPRFVAAAQAGYWALVRWHKVETRGIKEIAFDEIKRAGRPMKEKELFSLIAKRRPVKRRSIPRMLAKSSRFKKVGPKLWAICE